MKKTLIAFMLTTAAVWAAPEGNVYHTIADPTWHVTRIGSRWVIEDSRGFFVGYYVPRPTAPTVAAEPPASVPAPAVTSNSAPQSNSGSSSSSNQASGDYSGGYGNYSGYGYGYGYNGFGNNGFYRNNYYNHGGYHYNANCQPQQQQPSQPGRDKNDIPTGTPWQAVIR